jgi:UDPglucose 6-dehydrogenase
MKIGIVGLGVVGRAIRSYHEINGDEIIGIDISSSDWILLRECDGIYISVPSPSNVDGSCNVEILSGVLSRIYEIVGDLPIPLISKVTAPPEQYSQLSERYWQLVYCPEFLTAENANLDYLTTDYWIIGGELGKVAGSIISKLDNIVLTDIRTASLYKYLMNSYLAMKVTFMNEFYELAMRHGIEWDEVLRLSEFDSRIGGSHMRVPGRDGMGWSGTCFPKDLSAIEYEMDRVGIRGIISEVIRINVLQRNKD